MSDKDTPKVQPDAKATEDATKNESATTAAALLENAGTTNSLDYPAYEDSHLDGVRISYVSMRATQTFTGEFFLVTVSIAPPMPQSKNEGELTWIVPRTANAKALSDRLIGHVKVHGAAQTFVDICNVLKIKGPPNTVLLGEDYTRRQENRANYVANNAGPVQGESRRPMNRAPSRVSNAALDALAD